VVLVQQFLVIKILQYLGVEHGEAQQQAVIGQQFIFKIFYFVE
jgi:hypothetical protein